MRRPGTFPSCVGLRPILKVGQFLRQLRKLARIKALFSAKILHILKPLEPFLLVICIALWEVVAGVAGAVEEHPPVHASGRKHITRWRKGQGQWSVLVPSKPSDHHPTLCIVENDGRRLSDGTVASSNQTPTWSKGNGPKQLRVASDVAWDNFFGTFG